MQALDDRSVVRRVHRGRTAPCPRSNRADNSPATIIQALGVPTEVQVLDCGGTVGARLALVYEPPLEKLSRRRGYYRRRNRG